jgi:hypothetical protein
VRSHTSVVLQDDTDSATIVSGVVGDFDDTVSSCVHFVADVTGVIEAGNERVTSNVSGETITRYLRVARSNIFYESHSGSFSKVS